MDIIDEICVQNEFSDQALYDAERFKTSPIRNFFVGKVIFLTGATGFLGQLYLEKLLRCDVERVFILARAKKSQPPKERLKEIFDGIQFSKLKLHDPNFLERITIVEGNLEKLGLDINDSDLRLLQDTVNIVIHAGADVRFNKRLVDLVLANLRGTREMLHMAESFKKLQVFAYISTAYSNCVYGHTIYERFYQPPVNPDDIIAYVERIESCPEEMDNFQVITEGLIKPWPNTYSYTKSLSEEVVRRFGLKFPICIMRPSIVVSTFQEPVPGWTNSLFGVNGIVVANGLGFLRIHLNDLDAIVDFMCADFVINGTLAAIWATNKNNENRSLKQALTGTDIICRDSNPQIYCLGTSVDCQMTHGAFKEAIHSYAQDVICNKFLWVACDNRTTSLFMYKYLSIFYHLIPSIFFDFILFVKGEKMRLMPMMKKITEFAVAVSYFSLREWILDNSNMRAVINQMTSTDQELFLCDGLVLKKSLPTWCQVYVLGLRKYIVKDTVTKKSTITKHKILRIVQFFVRIGFYVTQILIIYALAKCLGIVRAIFG